MYHIKSKNIKKIFKCKREKCKSEYYTGLDYVKCTLVKDHWMNENEQDYWHRGIDLNGIEIVW